MTKEYLFDAYKLAKFHKIKHFGIHVMSQSNCLDINYWENLIDDIFDIIFELYYKFKIVIEFIDIGGGIGIPYKPDETEIDLEKLVLLLRNRFDYNINKYSMNYEPILITECGRYITGPYGWLVSRCQSIKETENGIFYGLDANMAHLMRPGMYNAYHHITISRLSYKNDLEKANVVGTLCENNDWFCKNRDLPKGIKKGDLFILHDCGAHAYSMGFNYNSKLHCPEILLTKNGIREIRKRENIDYHLQNTLLWINNKNLCKFLYIICIVIIFVCFLYIV
jgi:diaminopimelate decarboxylase